MTLRCRPWMVAAVLAAAMLAGWPAHRAQADAAPPPAGGAGETTIQPAGDAGETATQTATDDAGAAGDETRVDGAGLDGDGIESRRLGSGKGSSPVGGAREWLQMFVALLLVGGLIVLARFALRRLGPRAALLGGGTHGPIEVLARAPAGPRQHLLLVRMGSRVVLVGSAPGGLARLAEASDHAEVQRLMDACRVGRVAQRSQGDAAPAGDKP